MLVNKHGADKLYQVTSNISGSKDMDLTLQRGQIVALLHGMDTKGNTNRWLVDSGGTARPTCSSFDIKHNPIKYSPFSLYQSN